MEKASTYLLFAVVIIVGGLVYLHYNKTQTTDDSNATKNTVDKTVIDPNNLYVQFYGTGNGTWIPGNDINIDLPDNSPTTGIVGSGEYDITTSVT